MKLIVLIGLGVQEKIVFTTQLAHQLTQQHKKVIILDSLPGEGFSPEQLNEIPSLQLLDAWTQLPTILQHTPADRVLWAVSPAVVPSDLSLIVEGTRSFVPDWEITLIGLLDDRTCDCFPHVRADIEDVADIVVRFPFDVQDIVTTIEEVA